MKHLPYVGYAVSDERFFSYQILLWKGGAVGPKGSFIYCQKIIWVSPWVFLFFSRVQLIIATGARLKFLFSWFPWEWNWLFTLMFCSARWLQWVLTSPDSPSATAGIPSSDGTSAVRCSTCYPNACNSGRHFQCERRSVPAGYRLPTTHQEEDEEAKERRTWRCQAEKSWRWESWKMVLLVFPSELG